MAKDSDERKDSRSRKRHKDSACISKLELKKKKRKRARSSSEEYSSTSSSSSSEDRRKSHKKASKKLSKSDKKVHKTHKHKAKKAKKSKTKSKESSDNQDKDNDVGPQVQNQSQPQTSKGPMTKEEWEKQQSVVRRVFDTDTGRTRLIKGSGEVIEEIVSRDEQKRINKLATQGDGISYSMQTGTLR